MVEGSRNKDKVVDIEKFWHRKRRSNPPQNEKAAFTKKSKNGGKATMQNLLHQANELSCPTNVEFKGKYSDPPNPN